MIGMVLLASPVVGAAAAGVVLRWQEIQDSRSAATTTTTTTTAPTSTSEPQRQTEPLEESFVAPQVEVIAPPPTVTLGTLQDGTVWEPLPCGELFGSRSLGRNLHIDSMECP